jgi:hypothetical protein
MKFFNKVLGGNIPLSVLEFINPNNNFRLSQQINHLQLVENMENTNMDTNIRNLFNSNYGVNIKMSLELSREKVFSGLVKIIDQITKIIFNKNKKDLEIISGFGTVSEENNNFINLVTKQILSDYENEMLKIISGIKNINNNIIANIIILAGLNNKSKIELDHIQKQMELLLELNSFFRVENLVMIPNIIKEELSDSKIKSCNGNIDNCLFNDMFIKKLADGLFANIEGLLNKLMNTAKHDKTCYVFVLSTEISNAFANYQNDKVIENFGFNIGNTDIDIDSTRLTKISEIEKNINQSKVISGMTKLLSNAITKATSDNQSDLLRTIAISSKISFSGIRGTSFKVSGIKQSSKIDSNVEATFAQNIQNKIATDIANNLKNQIELQQTEISKDESREIVDEKLGTNFGDLLKIMATETGSTVRKIADTVKDILTSNIGNTTQKKTEKEITDQLKNKFNLDQSFTYNKTDDISNQIENILSSQNISKCVNDTKANQLIDFTNINVSGPIEIDNISQENVVNDIMKCAFNQDILNEISTNIVNSQENLIKQIVENINTKISESERKQEQTDIASAGVAAAKILESAGEAVSTGARGIGEGVSTGARGIGEGVSTGARGIGEGVSTGAKGIGEGVSTGAKGIGQGVSGAWSGLTLPLTIGAVVIVLIIIIGVIILSRNNNDDNDYEEDE